MAIKRYEDMEAWKFAHKALLATLNIIRTFPIDERFNLVSQMRRAALSVPANIVEGFGRWHPKEKIRFYNMSQSSLEELSYFYRVAKDVGYIKDDVEVRRVLDSTARMLKRLVQKTPYLPSYSQFRPRDS